MPVHLKVFRIYLTLKPIFHCNAKPLTLGVHAVQYPQHETFALPIPTCWIHKGWRTQRQALQTQCQVWWTQREPVVYVRVGCARVGFALAL